MRRKRRVKLSLAALTLTLLLAACESGYKKSPVVTAQPMSCSGNVPAQVTLYSPDDATLTFEDKNYELRRVASPSGVKYGNRDLTFWKQGIDALITRKDGTMTSCTYIPRSGL